MHQLVMHHVQMVGISRRIFLEFFAGNCCITQRSGRVFIFKSDNTQSLLYYYIELMLLPVDVVRCFLDLCSNNLYRQYCKSPTPKVFSYGKYC